MDEQRNLALAKPGCVGGAPSPDEARGAQADNDCYSIRINDALVLVESYSAGQLGHFFRRSPFPAHDSWFRAVGGVEQVI